MQVSNTVKLGDKERFDKEQIGIKELIMDYLPLYTINLLLDTLPKLGMKEHQIVKISKKRDFRHFFDQFLGFTLKSFPKIDDSHIL